MPQPPLRTPRLELICADLSLSHALRADPAVLGSKLNARIPADWPPELMRGGAIDWLIRLYSADPAIGGWGMWFIILTDQPSDTGPRTLAGSCGFKGRPGAVGGPGTVEIGYGLLGPFWNRGYATEAVAALVPWAFTDPQVQRITAHTFERHTASLAVLRKNRFTFAGPGTEPVDENERQGRGELVLYELTRDAWRCAAELPRPRAG